LADVKYQLQEDEIKAEELVRDALRIRLKLHGLGDNNVAVSSFLLARILMNQDKMGDETRDLFERSLATFIRFTGSDGISTASAYIGIGYFYLKLSSMQSAVDAKRKLLGQAKACSQEAIRIRSLLLHEKSLQHYFYAFSNGKYNNLFRSELYGPDHPRTVEAKELLSEILGGVYVSGLSMHVHYA
jgi:hypothetical protein